MRRLTILFAALGALLLVSAAPAMGAELTFKETFGSAAQPSFSSAISGLVVDQSSGDLLVLDEAEGTLNRFNADGTPHNFSALGTNAISGLAGVGAITEQQVAIDESGGSTDGDIYVTEVYSGVVEIFASSGEHIGQLNESSAGAFSEPCGVAVDSSGNVYVGDYSGKIDKFANPPVNGSTIAEFTSVEEPCLVAAGAGPSAGSLFAATYGGPLFKLDATTGAVDYEVSPEGTFGLAVDPATGYVYQRQGLTSKLVSFAASGASPSEVTSTNTLMLGVAVNGSSGDVYMGSSGKVSVYSQPAGPAGPTNLRTLTLTKSPAPNAGTGTGSVSSKPKGIKCGTTCDEAVANMYKSTPVELTAKPGGETSSFVKWENLSDEGGACDDSTSPTCTVPMSEDTELEAIFAGTSKAFSPAEALTVSKGESTGKGTVKGPGLGCEADCTSTVVLFQGPITEPKAKPGKVVILKQSPAFGSAFAGWSGCESEPEGNCQVAMESAKEVTAEYEALPNKTLTVNKEYAKGNGSVSSKPKGIKCGTTCTQAVAQMPEGAAVELVAKPSSGTFVKWEGGDCAGSTNPVCIVEMDADETTKAVFSDPGKAFSPQETLTLNKAGSGFGTVKAAGLGCEVLCSSTSVIYQGPLTEPKVKPGKVVILKATSAPGSKAVAWTGCDSNPSPSECSVEMDEAHAVTATFDELE